MGAELLILLKYRPNFSKTEPPEQNPLFAV